MAPAPSRSRTATRTRPRAPRYPSARCGSDRAGSNSGNRGCRREWPGRRGDPVARIPDGQDTPPSVGRVPSEVAPVGPVVPAVGPVGPSGTREVAPAGPVVPAVRPVGPSGTADVAPEGLLDRVLASQLRPR